jgi:hypothetical protein
VELDELYRQLKHRPRDARWLLRRVGMDYEGHIRALRESGRPVAVTMEDVDGVWRAVYRAEDQLDLFARPTERVATSRRSRRPRPRRKLKAI